MSSSFLSLISSKEKIVPAILSTVLLHLFTRLALANFLFTTRKKPRNPRIRSEKLTMEFEDFPKGTTKIGIFV